MPLFTNTTPLPGVPPHEPVPLIIDTASNYSNKNFNSQVMAYIDGFSQTGVYYNQYIGEDDILINSADINNPTLKQYLKINNFELRIVKALETTHNDVTSTDTVSGAANIYPVIVPLVGDIFIADIQPGVYGVFEVKTANRTGLYKESAWYIEYVLISYLTSAYQLLIDAFVIKDEMVFDPSLLADPNGPLRTLSENSRALSKEKDIRDIQEYYITKFYDINTETFLLPSEDETLVYDPHVVKFWNTHNDGENSIKPKEYDTRSWLYDRKYITIYDVISKQDEISIRNTVKSMDIIPSSMFSTLYIRYNIDHTNIDKIILPRAKNGLPLYGFVDENNQPIPPYVVSEDFYNGVITTIPFEVFLRRVIRKELLSYVDVQSVLMSILSSSVTEQFYKLPIVIILLKMAR